MTHNFPINHPPTKDNASFSKCIHFKEVFFDSFFTSSCQFVQVDFLLWSFTGILFNLI